MLRKQHREEGKPEASPPLLFLLLAEHSHELFGVLLWWLCREPDGGAGYTAPSVGVRCNLQYNRQVCRSHNKEVQTRSIDAFYRSLPPAQPVPAASGFSQELNGVGKYPRRGPHN